MKRIASMRVKLHKKLQEYYELAGVNRSSNVKAIMNLDPILVEEEIRRTDEALDDLRHFEPKRRREDRKEQLRERIREKERLREEHAHHIQDLEDRLMGRRTRRASDNSNCNDTTEILPLDLLGELNKIYIVGLDAKINSKGDISGVIIAF